MRLYKTVHALGVIALLLVMTFNTAGASVGFVNVMYTRLDSGDAGIGQLEVGSAPAGGVALNLVVENSSYSGRVYIFEREVLSARISGLVNFPPSKNAGEFGDPSVMLSTGGTRDSDNGRVLFLRYPTAGQMFLGVAISDIHGRGSILCLLSLDNARALQKLLLKVPNGLH